MKLKINDYVRTKQRGFQYPQIARIKSMSRDEGYKNQLYIELDHSLLPNCEFHIYEEDISKSSPNIIDLIEIGDIITFKDDYVVYNVIALPDNAVGLDVFYLAKTYDGETEDISVSKEQMEKYIKSIVTKEMYSSVEYKVGEE